MTTLRDTDENSRCPECGKISAELVPIRDNGKGKKVCVTCKRGLNGKKNFKNN